MKFLNYRLTLVAVLAILLASCAGDGNKDKTNEKDKDKIKDPVVQIFPAGTVWESQPKKEGTNELDINMQQRLEFKTADTLIFKYRKVSNCFGKLDYSNIFEIKYTYDASKKEVKLAEKMKFLRGSSGSFPCNDATNDDQMKAMKDMQWPISNVFEPTITNIDANTTKIEYLNKNFIDRARGNPADQKELIKQQ